MIMSNLQWHVQTGLTYLTLYRLSNLPHYLAAAQAQWRLAKECSQRVSTETLRENFEQTLTQIVA